MGLGFLSSGSHDKDVVGHGIPSVMYTDEEQQQRSRGDTKHRPMSMGASDES
jgi:hypothetical protein